MVFTSILNNPRERKRFLRFAVVGTIGAIIDFGTFNILFQIVHIQPVVASIISFTAAITSNYIWNRYWTYPDSREKNISKQLIQFALVNLVGLGIRTPIFWGLSRLFVAMLNAAELTFTFASNKALSNNGALAIAVVVVMFWNFFANRYWTFNDVE